MKVSRAAALLALGMVACTGRERSTVVQEESSESSLGALSGSTSSVAVFNFTDGVPEAMDAGGLFPLPASRTFTGLVRTIRRVASDDEAKGVFVRLGAVELGWAKSAELGTLFHELKASGKNVTCHAHTLTNSSAWFALRGCSEIWLSPAGDVNTVGLAAQLTYLKGALDKIEVDVDFLSMGKYKSGAEPLTREGPSEPSRANLTATLGSIRHHWLKSAAAARNKPAIKKALEDGPWTPPKAKALGLIDQVGFESDALEKAKSKAQTQLSKLHYGPGTEPEPVLGITDIVRLLAGVDDGKGTRPRIAVIPAVGSINMRPGGVLDTGGISASAMSKTLNRLRKDDAVKAVVLRIDSPGGSALASDLIWHDVLRLRKAKPVVVSVGEMAASGGYYIAVAGQRIIAEPTSIVGSIGVFGGKIVIADALEQFGINSVTFPASPEPGAAARAAYLSPLAEWDEATRQKVRSYMKHIYDTFLKRVTQGRKLPRSKVEELAQGRIYSGAQAKAHALVDELGGLSRALEVARELGGLDADAPVTLEGGAEGLLELLLGGEEPGAARVARGLERVRGQRAQLQSWVPENLRMFVGSVQPLLNGERALAALPFAVTLR